MKRPFSTGACNIIFSFYYNMEDLPEITKYCIHCQKVVAQAQIIQRIQGHYSIYCDDCLEQGLQFKNTVHFVESDGSQCSDVELTTVQPPAPIGVTWRKVLRCLKRVFWCLRTTQNVKVHHLSS